MHHQLDLSELSNKRLFTKAFLSTFYLSGYKHFLIVRNPHRKLISFYQDKFRVFPSEARDDFSWHQWESSHKVFPPHLGINRTTSAVEIMEKLIDVRLDRFIDLLSKVYLLEPHLWPQNYIRNLMYGRIVLHQIHFDQVLKMESTDDMCFMAYELGLNLSKKYRSTHAAPIQTYFSSTRVEEANKIYKQDFQLYNYELRRG